MKTAYPPERFSLTLESRDRGSREPYGNALRPSE